MTIQEFAQKSDMIITECDEVKWGGKFGYHFSHTPQVQFCGFTSEDKCCEHWLVCKFGESTAVALTGLFNGKN